MKNRNDMAWYVCGPMTGIPRFNYPLFDLVTNYLRLNSKRRVISPTELDSVNMQLAARESLDGEYGALVKASGETWGDVLARDVRLIEKEVGTFALLEGWERSRGARLEVFVGLLVGVKNFYDAWPGSSGKVYLHRRSISAIRDSIRSNMP